MLILFSGASFGSTPVSVYGWQQVPRALAVSTSISADEHWSFQTIRRPVLPKVEASSWARNPIDLFILAKCEKAGIRPAASAPRHVMIRRLYLDLCGIPPEVDEVEKFVNDRRSDAYSNLVDRLLASQHYGIRRGQHWLDLARFAETDGFEHDKIRQHAWRYRDWVISALNGDMPFDQFLAWQLAGDEISDDPQAITATTFGIAGPDMPDINSQEERRSNVLNEMTGAIGSTILGLQLGCAQCHDHKYDPISQNDFYRLRAIFEPAVQVKKNQSLSVLTENILLKNKVRQVTPTHFLIRGDWRNKGPRVEPGVPQNLSPNLEFQAIPTRISTGRRAGFSRWLTDKQNPLTARVIANRIWQYHFGTGLVATPSDFGLMGETPSHPALLDWLAAELMENNWSLKHLSRLILLSATYQQQSRSPGGSETVADQLFSPYTRWRLSGESIRDSMLAASGALNSKMEGRGVLPPIPAEMRNTLLKNQWVTSKNQADHYRRSIYVFARRNLRYPIFEVFDRPDGNQSCPRRNSSTTAPQSLHLLNSRLALDLSRRLVGDVLEDHKSVTAAITAIVNRVVARPPEPNELAKLQEFVDQCVQELKTQTSRELAVPIPPPNDKLSAETGVALTYVCLALFNTNEFIYVD